MDVARGSVSSGSTPSFKDDAYTNSASNTYYLRQGRRYLRDLPYPLPCDLPELQRQNLHTLLGVTIFGTPICSPVLREQRPKKVLEIGCGSGYWSSLCHDFFDSIDYTGVQFTGLDIVPLAPDLRREGVNWRFVQHDLRKIPLPFDDGEFDIVLCKDLSFVVPRGQPSQRLIDECIRVLRQGGIFEIWETDHIIRSLLPHPPPPSIGRRQEDHERAASTGTFMIFPGTPFAGAQNKYLQDYNTWIGEALDRRRLQSTPCVRIAEILLQEDDHLSQLGYRRIAIPLGELRWERDGTDREAAKRRGSQARRGRDNTLTDDQAALRTTALLVLLQMIESLEPILKEVSGKNQEEWQRWWTWMMTDLLENKGASSGECLEMGAWWARKV
jgi:SAM-dependent methyltransferase